MLSLLRQVRASAVSHAIFRYAIKLSTGTRVPAKTKALFITFGLRETICSFFVAKVPFEFDMSPQFLMSCPSKNSFTLLGLFFLAMR